MSQPTFFVGSASPGGAGGSGAISLTTGTAGAGDSGDVRLSTGASSNGNTGSINATVQTSSTGHGGNIQMSAGYLRCHCKSTPPLVRMWGRPWAVPNLTACRRFSQATVSAAVTCQLPRELGLNLGVASPCCHEVGEIFRLSLARRRRVLGGQLGSALVRRRMEAEVL